MGSRLPTPQREGAFQAWDPLSPWTCRTMPVWAEPCPPQAWPPARGPYQTLTCQGKAAAPGDLDPQGLANSWDREPPRPTAPIISGPGP